MKSIKVVFATKKDEQFLLENAQLNGGFYNRKLKYNEILVAKVEDINIGFLIFDYLWSHIPFIAQIWIHVDFRKKGVGKSMLNYFEQCLSDNNYMMLFSSSMENAKEAQEWHRHMGFKDCGTIAEINDNNTGEVFFRKSLKRDS